MARIVPVLTFALITLVAVAQGVLAYTVMA